MLRNCLKHRYSLDPSTPIESDIRIKNHPSRTRVYRGFREAYFGPYGRSPKKPTVGRRDDPR